MTVRDRKRGKRKLSKSKTYGFNPWLDQIDSINALMYQNSGVKESVVLRKLVDEALAARRQKENTDLRQELFLTELGQDIDDIKDTLEGIKEVIITLIERVDGKPQK
jgi:DNA-binding HxlR family transcriptional regulator